MLGLVVVATALLNGCGDKTPPPTFEPRATPAPGDHAGPAGAQSGGANSSTPMETGEMQTSVALVNGVPFTMRELVDPLIKAYGLDFLLHLVQRDLARQYAKERGIIVTQKDFDDELRLVLDKLFKDADDNRLLNALERAEKEKRDSDVELIREEIKSERDQFLEQFLTTKHMDRIEFDIQVQIDAYLRKIAEQEVAIKREKDRKKYEEKLQATFGQLYGEHIYVKYISLVNMADVAEAKRRLAAGETFENVARQMSQDPLTAGLGGELPGFTRKHAIRGGEVFKEVAFSLKDGEVSDVVAMGNRYAIIKRIRVEPPKFAKYENVKEYVAKALNEAELGLALKDLKRELVGQSMQKLKILDPVLLQKYNERVERQASTDKTTKAEMARQVRLKKLLETPATTLPAFMRMHTTAPTTTTTEPATQPAQAGDRPPATQQGK